MSDFLALIEWFTWVLSMIAAFAFGAMVILVSIAVGWLDVQRKKGP